MSKAPEYRIPEVIIDFQPLSDLEVSAAVPWHLADRNLPRYWELTGGGKDVTVAVLDTGVQGPVKHPETQRALKKVLSVYSDDGFDRGDSSHGQHVCGLIGGVNCGAAPNCDLISIKVLADSGGGGEDAVAAGIDMAVAQGADIISMSLGAPSAGRIMSDACARAFAKGVICIAATGNDSRGSLSYPAAFDDYCLATGAIDRQKRLAQFSNYDRRGGRVDLVDYGVQVVSSVLGGGYRKYSGTSMATPLAAGMIANYISFAKQRDLWKGNIRDKYALLASVTEDLGATGRDGKFGWGMLDAAKAFADTPKPDAPEAAPPPVVDSPGDWLLDGDQLLFAHVRRGNKTVMVFPGGQPPIEI